MFEHSSFHDDNLRRPVRVETPVPDQAIEAIEPAISMHEQLNSWWEGYALDERIDSLAEYLGQSQVVSKDIPLAYGVPRPVQVGARNKDCYAGSSIEGTDIHGLKGKIVFYRTQVSGTSFHEAGFYCFMLAVTDSYGQSAVPHLVYGDIDAATWPEEVSKLEVQEMLEPHQLRDQTVPHSILENHSVTDSNKKQNRYSLQRVQSLFSPALQKRRKPMPSGIFRQNETPLFGDATPEEIWHVTTAITREMQQFIDAHLVPDQTKVPVTERTEVKPAVRPEVSKTCRPSEWNTIAPVTMYLDKEAMQLPYLSALSDVGWNNIVFNHEVRSVLSDLHCGISPADAVTLFHRSELTPEEIKAVHATYPPVFSVTSTDRKNRAAHLSSPWSQFLTRFPDIYPNITPDRLLDAYNQRSAGNLEPWQALMKEINVELKHKH